MKYDPNIESRYGIRLVDEHTVRKEAQLGTKSHFEFVRSVVKHFIRHPDSMVVPVYRFETIEEKDEGETKTWGTYSYAYEMQRLGMLDNDERAIVDASHAFYRTGIPRDIKHDVLQMGWATYPKLMKFLNTVFKMGRYTDIHSGNFMKDEDGEYRIIDLEGFIYAGTADNSWVSKD